MQSSQLTSARSTLEWPKPQSDKDAVQVPSFACVGRQNWPPACPYIKNIGVDAVCCLSGQYSLEVANLWGWPGLGRYEKTMKACSS
jgi:hypothetical protein